MMTREELIDFGETFLEVNKDSKNSRTYEFIDTAVKVFKQELCEDTISRQAALDCLTATGLKKFDFILDARNKIKNLPPIIQQPRIGHWIKGKYTEDDMRYNDNHYKCNGCGRVVDFEENFCPDCGLRMQDAGVESKE